MRAEKQIEDSFIVYLTENLKYRYREDIKDRASLEENFKKHFEKLNKVSLSNSEFERLRDKIITPDVFSASKHLREINTFLRDDDTPLDYSLVNIKDWCKNEFEIVSQLKINTENSYHRYDVIILINGLPLVQVELKSLDITPKRAMEQIANYKNDIGNGFTNSLLCFMQLFIVSNENKTYYFANNNKEHFIFNADEKFLPIYELADESNKKITHLRDFANIFLSKCTLGNLISRYMVLVVSEQKLMIMRPYQIYAVKAIVDCIEQNRGNGYIWHTTGSGKTLTSFKASTLLKDNPNIEKCLFVVDRKDLDRQTREEFNKFQKDCVEENTNTETLVNRLLSEDKSNKVIVATIQKLGLALDENSRRNIQKKKHGHSTFKERLAPLADKRIVIIFDECHRSQFGDSHKAIKEFFPKAQLFGFTGTPIFEKNSTYKQIDGKELTCKTTKDIFEKELHKYTITEAIEDRNVLKFHIDYFTPDESKQNKAAGALTKKAVVQRILDKHDAVTNERRFNAIFATASINDAIEYYNLFKEKQEELLNSDENYKPFNIAAIFSPPAEGDNDVLQLQEDLTQEKIDNKEEPSKKKEALKNIIDDYNSRYGENCNINEFDKYYQDVQKRIKEQGGTKPHGQKIDITIVVDMLLTGFDSKYLNTLYVDKNLKHHGLIQAFSRTNRVLNDTKPYGNILDFRNQINEVDEAIALFSGKDIENAKKTWIVEEAPEIIKKFNRAVEELKTFMKTQGLEFKPEEISNLKGDIARAEFIQKFKEIQRLKIQINQYTDIGENETKELEKLITEDTLRGFRGMYLETSERLKKIQDKKETTPEVNQLDFEYVLCSSAVIDYDYIINLISRFTQSTENIKVRRKELVGILSSTSNFIDTKEDIIEYVDTLEIGKHLNQREIEEGYQRFRAEKSAKIIIEIANRHGIEPNSLKLFVEAIMDRMIFDGEKLTDLFEVFNLGWRERRDKELELMADLVPFLNKLSEGKEIRGLSAYE